MSSEARVALEREVAFLKEKSREHDQKLDDILAIVVGLHRDLAALERKMDRGFERIDRRSDELPAMIAQVVGEVLRTQGRG